MGTERIAKAFQPSHTAFMPYMVLGYPDMHTSPDVLKMLEEAGADLLELGIPFSDPIADGKVIQNATHQALQNGVSVAGCISIVSQLRASGSQLPFIFMGYYNPILAYGIDRFVSDCAAAGVDGFIIPDLPPEEAGEMEEACNKAGLAMVYLLAPTSTDERIELVAKRSQGFIYLVSTTGVTGERDRLPEDLANFVDRVRKVTDKPLAVGFGIGNGQQAKLVGELADGVIVGSALVRSVAKSLEGARDLAVEICAALDG